MALTISPNVPSRKPELFGVCIAFGSLTAITILLRLWARLKVLRVGLLLDDFTILIAAGLALYFCINVPQQTGFGLGYHIYDLTDPSYFSGSLKLFFVGELVYYLCVTFTKLSLLILYLRIFVPRGLRMITWVTMAFVSLTLVAFIFAVVFQCHPIEFAWDKSINGKCVNQTAIFYSHAGINILTDFVIYILPMKMLWGVLRPKKDKIGLVVVFAIGIFVCLAGIIRLWALQKTSISEDPSWDNEPSAVWSIIECCVGVICASVPSLKPLFNQSSNRVGSSIRLSERHTRSGGKGTQDLESLSGKWDVRISGRMNNDGVGRNESPTESVQSLFGLQTHPREGDDKTGIYTSRTVTISHADG